MQQFVEFGRLHAKYGGLCIDHALGEHIHRDLDHGRTGTLAAAGLQHPQFAALDREFDVLHILEVLFEVLLDLIQLGECGGHHLFEGRIFRRTFAFRNALQFGPAARSFDRNLLGGTDAGYHVFALGVDEVLAVENVLARCGVTREGYAGCRGFAHVAENHRLYVHGGAPFGRDVVEFAVEDRALVHPAAEHGADGTPELFPRVGGEIFAGHFLHGGFKTLHEFLEVVGRQVGIELDALFLLHRIDDLLERIFVLFALRLHIHHHVAVHLYETAVRVPCEPGIVHLFGQSFDHLVVESEVQDRVHHARHRRARAGTDRYQQRVGAVTELHIHDLLDPLHGGFHFGFDQFDDALFAEGIIFGAHFGRDRETRRHRNADQVHLRQVGSLAAEQLSHLSVAFGLLVAEGIDSLRFWHMVAFFDLKGLFKIF